MPVKKSTRVKKSARVNMSTRLKKSMRAMRGIGAGPIALAVLSVMAVAVLFAAHPPSPSADIARLESAPERAVAQAGPNNAVGSPAAASASAADSATKVSAAKSAPVTITGCLERADEAFRLKNTSGVDAPTSRSWKSAFLRKGPASIEVVDAANRVRLSDHIGERVSVTGTLVDREMTVRSLQRVAPFCTSNTRVKI